MRQSATPETTCPYELGAPIELADLLALPPDGRRYARDAQGRLAIMAPDDWDAHGTPLSYLHRVLVERLAHPWWVLQERAIALPAIYGLKDGKRLRSSFLGPKAVEPDLAVFAEHPLPLHGPHGLAFVAPKHLRLVVEILSADTWRSDLGIGKADDVDRPRTYLASKVPEYWTINFGVTDKNCPIRPRSGRFLARAASGSWEELPVKKGRVRSRAVPGLELALEAFFDECAG